MPPAGAALRGEQMAFLAALAHQKFTDPKVGELLAAVELSGSTIAAGWYGQGLRLIDASNARDLRQVGYYYVTGTDPATNPSSLSWDTAWHGDLVYLFDMSRGIEILRLRGGPSASTSLPTVQEPRATSDPLAAQPVREAGSNALVCPVFSVPGKGIG